MSMTGSHRSNLDAFARALPREAHQLARQPELLWPVLYNRLRWEAEPAVAEVLAHEAARHALPGAAPWLRQRTSLDETPALMRTLAEHSSTVDLCSFSPDGRGILATSKYDRRPKLWEVATGHERATLTGHDGWVTACAFSPDGCTLVSASRDETLKLWDTRVSHPHRTSVGHTSHLTAVAISLDGATTATGSQDATLKLWDTATDRPRATLSGHAYYVGCCAFSPDGHSLICTSLRKQLELRDPASGVVRAALPLPGELSHLALHPWQPLAVCGGDLGRIYPVELVGAAYGPIVVTALARGGETSVCCPMCQQRIALGPGQLGAVLACPLPGCAGSMRVNAFVITLA